MSKQLGPKEPMDLSVDVIRKALLKSAGQTPIIVGARVKKAFDTIDSLMGATKVERASFQGEFKDERTDADNGVRLKASQTALSASGVMPSKGESLQQPKVVKVIINLPDWALPTNAKTNAIEVECKAEDITPLKGLSGPTKVLPDA